MDAFEVLLPGQVSLSLIGASVFWLFVCSEYLPTLLLWYWLMSSFGTSFSVEAPPTPPSASAGFSALGILER